MPASPAPAPPDKLPPVGLIGPVVAMTAAAILLIGALLFFSVASLDSDAKAGAERIAASILETKRSLVAYLAADYSGWDEAIANAVVAPDEAWITENIGKYLYDAQDITLSAVIDGRDHAVTVFADGAPVEDRGAFLSLPAVRTLIERTRAEAAEAGYPTGISFEATAVAAVPVAHGTEPMIVSASVFVPWTDDPDWARGPHAGAVLLLALPLGAAFLEEIGRYGLVDAAIVSPGAPLADGAGAVPLLDADGDPVAWLAFAPDRPGSRLLERSLPGLAAILAAILVAGGWLLRRALHSAAVQRDLLARLARERDTAARANESKSAFLANISHELRTPLNAIIGFAETIPLFAERPNGPAKVREYSGDIQTAGRHLLALINDILDLSRIEAGEEALEESIFPVASVAASVAVLVAAGPGRARIETDVAQDLPQLRADERKVRQMLTNLLSNAVKFGGTRVALSARLSAEGGVQLAVADDGPGIPPDDLEHIAAAFHRGRNAWTRKQEGHGLGLAITRAQIMLHGGRMMIESTVGRGTIVTLLFPPERSVTA
jgi:signal transduction histidine kinase